VLEIDLVDLYPSSVLVKELNRERAGIFRIAHIRNVRWSLRKGLRCGNSDVRDPTIKGE